MKISPSRTQRLTGFSLVEAIFTIAIIGIMSSIVVAAIANASRDANRIVARQQQAALNSALNAWVMGTLRVPRGESNEGQVYGLEQVRSMYNGRPTSLSRLLLISPDLEEGYLDEATRAHFIEHTTNSNRIESSALKLAKQHLTLPIWQTGEFPKAMLQDN